VKILNLFLRRWKSAWFRKKIKKQLHNYCTQYNYCEYLNLIFTRESSYCFQRVLAITILSVCPSVHPSVCPSVTRVDQSKTVQAKITNFLLSAAQKTPVSETIKLFFINLKGSPRTRALNERGMGRICDFWPTGRCISVTMRDRA